MYILKNVSNKRGIRFFHVSITRHTNVRYSPPCPYFLDLTLLLINPRTSHSKAQLSKINQTAEKIAKTAAGRHKKTSIAIPGTQKVIDFAADWDLQVALCVLVFLFF